MLSTGLLGLLTCLLLGSLGSGERRKEGVCLYIKKEPPPLVGALSGGFYRQASAVIMSTTIPRYIILTNIHDIRFLCLCISVVVVLMALLPLVRILLLLRTSVGFAYDYLR